MKRNIKVIITAVLIIIVATSGILIAWFFFFGTPPDVTPNYPDLTISDHSLEEDNLTVNVTNIGNANANAVNILAKIDSVGLILYNNSLTPVDLDIDEFFIFSINLSDFEAFFSPKITYIINVKVDPNDVINETLETNNEISVEYYYEGAPLPLFDLITPNTYALNSTTTTFGYAVVFNGSQILLEDSLIITNGSINGYDVINSTILDNTNVNNENYSISIVLYRDQNLTIRNIWNPRLGVVLCNQSKLSLFNCSIQLITITGSNEVYLSNSSVEAISSAQYLQNLATIRILDNSSINACMILCPASLEIEYSLIQMLYIGVSANPYDQKFGYYVFGSIRNCSIYTLYTYGQAKLNLYGTEISQVMTLGNTRINQDECVITTEYVMQTAVSILNNSKVGSLLNGIILSSNSISITDGVVQGTGYMNNTFVINSEINTTVLMSVAVNGTGQVTITNFTSNLFLYDNALVTITDSGEGVVSSFGVYLQDSSKLIGLNTSFGMIFCQGNSSLDLSLDSEAQSVFINSTGKMSLDFCTFGSIGWLSRPLGNNKAEISNSNIHNFYAPPSCNVNITNCVIEILYEGISFQSGTNIYNSSGIFGSGSTTNNLNITGSLINNRTYKYIEIKGESNVIIENLNNSFVISVDSGNLTLFNCTIDSMQTKNNAIVNVNNCTFPSSGEITMISYMVFGPQSVMCYDNSHLYINNSTTASGMIMIVNNAAHASITNSAIFSLYTVQQATVNITDSILSTINVAASIPNDFALNLIRSTTENLITTSWNYSDQLLLFGIL